MCWGLAAWFSLTLAAFCPLSSHFLIDPPSLSLSAGWLSVHRPSSWLKFRDTWRIAGKLASLVDLVIQNMALDHSRINLPLTYRANDAHPKICPQEEANSSLSFLFAPSVLAFWFGLPLQHTFEFSFFFCSYSSNLLPASSFTMQSPLTPVHFLFSFSFSSPRVLVPLDRSLL